MNFAKKFTHLDCNMLYLGKKNHVKILLFTTSSNPPIENGGQGFLGDKEAQKCYNICLESDITWGILVQDAYFYT